MERQISWFHNQQRKVHTKLPCVPRPSSETVKVVIKQSSMLTRVGDGIGAVGGALGVRRDNRSSSSHRLDSGGHWVDGKGRCGWTGGSWFNYSHLSRLLGLGVRCHPLAVSWFGGYTTEIWI